MTINANKNAPKDTDVKNATAAVATAVVIPATVSPEKAERERRNIAKLKALADLAQAYKNKYGSYLLARRVERNKADRYTAVDATIEWIDKDGKTQSAPVSFSVLSLMKKANVPVEELKAALNEFRRCASIYSDYRANDSEKQAAFASAMVNADLIMLKVAGMPPKSLKSKQIESLLASAYDIAKNGGSDARKESEVVTKFEIMARMKLKGMEASNAFEERIRLKKARENNASTDSINAAANGTTTETEMVKREDEKAKQETAA